MSELEAFINNDDLCDYVDRVKMALIHHQFKSIHPFYDGNGRTGRILKILFLSKQNLLGAATVYLSRYLHRNAASKYLNQLADIGVLHKHKLGKDNYYLNSELCSLFAS